MKVCYLATSYPRSENDIWVPFVHSYARIIARKNKVVAVSSGSYGCPDFAVRDSVKIHRFTYFFRRYQRLTYTSGMLESYKKSFMAKLQAPFFLVSFFLKSFFLAKGCDVIHCQWTLSAFIGVLVKKIRKIPVVVTIQGADIRELPAWLNHFVINNVDAVLSCSPEFTDLVNSLGRPRRLFDVKNCLDFNKFLKPIPGRDVEKLRKELGISRNHFVITLVGRLVPMKDPITFIKAIPLVLRKTKKKVVFLLVGEGLLKRDVLALVKKLDIRLGKDLLFLGGRSDVHHILKLSRVFLSISALENVFNTAIIESMFSRVPCILTDAGYSRKVFTHMKNCFMIPPKNPQELADAMLSLMGNEKLLAKLSKGGRQLMKDEGFFEEDIQQRTQKIYETVTRSTS